MPTSALNMIIAIIITFVVVWIFTRDIVTSSVVTIVSNLIKMIAYYVHERAWLNIKWGLAK